MRLFHGSRTEGIAVLEPRLADHDRPYIYMSTIDVVAAFYLCNAVERPYYWFPYGFDKAGVPVYHELYPHALREVSEGVRGFIYEVDAQESDVLPFKNIPCARLGTVPMPVSTVTEVPDAWQLMQQYMAEGKLRLGRFEDKSDAELERWRTMLAGYLAEKKMVETPDCSYARFVREKFPMVWEKYIGK